MQDEVFSWGLMAPYVGKKAKEGAFVSKIERGEIMNKNECGALLSRVGGFAFAEENEKAWFA